MNQETINSGQIKTGDLLIVGNTLYTVTAVDHEAPLITKVVLQNKQSSNKGPGSRIHLILNPDHLITVMRPHS